MDPQNKEALQLMCALKVEVLLENKKTMQCMQRQNVDDVVSSVGFADDVISSDDLDGALGWLERARSIPHCVDCATLVVFGDMMCQAGDCTRSLKLLGEALCIEEYAVCVHLPLFHCWEYLHENQRTRAWFHLCCCLTPEVVVLAMVFKGTLTMEEAENKTMAKLMACEEDFQLNLRALGQYGEVCRNMVKERIKAFGKRIDARKVKELKKNEGTAGPEVPNYGLEFTVESIGTHVNTIRDQEYIITEEKKPQMDDDANLFVRLTDIQTQLAAKRKNGRRAINPFQLPQTMIGLGQLAMHDGDVDTAMGWFYIAHSMIEETHKSLLFSQDETDAQDLTKYEKALALKRYLLTQGSDFIGDALAGHQGKPSGLGSRERKSAEQANKQKTSKSVEAIGKSVILSQGLLHALSETRALFIQILECLQGCRWLQVVGKIIIFMAQSAAVDKLKEEMTVYPMDMHTSCTYHLGVATMIGVPPGAFELFNSDAAVLFQDVLKIDPSHAEAHNNLGLIQRQLKDSTGAVASFQSAIASNPLLHDARINLAATLHRDFSDRGPEAEEQYCLILKYLPERLFTHHNLGMVLASMGNHEKAVDHYHHELRLQPFCLATKFYLGISYKAYL